MAMRNTNIGSGGGSGASTPSTQKKMPSTPSVKTSVPSVSTSPVPSKNALEQRREQVRSNFGQRLNNQPVKKISETKVTVTPAPQAAVNAGPVPTNQNAALSEMQKAPAPTTRPAKNDMSGKGKWDSFVDETKASIASQYASNIANLADAALRADKGRALSDQLKTNPDDFRSSLGIAQSMPTREELAETGMTDEQIDKALEGLNGTRASDTAELVKEGMGRTAAQKAAEADRNSRNLNGLANFASRSISGAINQAPQMILNMAAPGSGDLWIAATSYADAVNDAESRGIDSATAAGYGAIVAGIEVASNYISSANKFDPKGILDDWQDALVANSGAKGGKALLMHYALNVLGEQIEEEAATIPEFLVDYFMLKGNRTEDGKFDWKKFGKEIWQTFIDTLGSTVVLGGLTGEYSRANANDFLQSIEDYRNADPYQSSLDLVREAVKSWDKTSQEDKNLTLRAVADMNGEDPAALSDRIEEAVENAKANGILEAESEAEVSSEAVPGNTAQENPAQPVSNALVAQEAPVRNEIADALVQQERTPISEYEGEQIFRSALDDSENAMPVKAFGKRLGRDIVVVEDLPLHANGVWMDGKIYIPESVIRSGKETWTVVRHELTHSLRGAKVFDKYINYAVDQMRTQMGDNWENYYNQKVQDYSRAYAGAENFDSLINEEIAAEYTQEYLFNNQEAVNQLVRSSRSTAQRIWQTLKDMARKLTGIDSPEAAAIRRAERMFAQAIAETNDSKNETNDTLFTLRSMREDIDSGVMENTLIESGVFDPGEAASFVANIEQAMKLIEPKRNFMDLNEDYGKDERTWLPFKQNSDKLYKVSMDFSTLCKKRIITQAIIERLNVARGEALDAKTQFAIEESLRRYQSQYKGLQVACALCYVEAARLKSPKTINQFLRNRTENMVNYYALAKGSSAKQLVDEAQVKLRTSFGLDPKISKEGFGRALAGMTADEFHQRMSFMGEESLNKLLNEVGYPVDNRTGLVTAGKAKSFFSQFNSFMRKNTVEAMTPEQRNMIEIAESLPAEKFLTADGLTELKREYPDIYNAFNRKVSSATRSKALEQDTPYYFGDASMVSQSLIDEMNKENGLRTQSWSDFQLEHLLDQISAIADLSTKGAKMHGYTKVPEFVEVNGHTGLMINNSLIPEGRTGMDENGNLIFSPTEGMPIETADDLRSRFADTDGNIAIGINDEQILKLLEADNIDYVIPYHRSGLCLHLRQIAKIDKWSDYTRSQNERVYDPSKGGNETSFSDWFTDDYYSDPRSGIEIMREAQQKYLDLCYERGLVPKFSQFLIDEGNNRYSVPVGADGQPINYWKMLIDRKMINQETGGIIEQKAVRPEFNWEDEVDSAGNVINRGIYSIIEQAEDPRMQKMVDDLTAMTERNLDNGYIQAIIDRDEGVQRAYEVYNMTHDDPQSIMADAENDEYEWTGDIKEGLPQKKEPAVSAPYKAAARFSLPAERYDNYSQIPGDVEGNYGFHAGDLGKAESRGSQGYYRGTGHYGTGTYFVGDPQELRYGYDQRPVETVDFSNYNLFAPQNSDDAYTLHEYLRALDGGLGNRDYIDSSRIEDIRNRARENVYLNDYNLEDVLRNDFVQSQDGRNLMNAADIISEARALMGNTFDDVLENASRWAGMDLTEDMSDLELAEHGEVLEAIDDTLGDGVNSSRRFNSLREDIADMYEREPDVARMTGRSPEEIRNVARNSNYDMGDADPYRSDSMATRFMRDLGYEGIDTRGLPDFDNTRYGSVIYDLKGRDLERKNANSPRFSLTATQMDSEGEPLSREQQNFFKDSKVRDEDGNLRVVYHGTDSNFTVFDRTKSRANMDIQGSFFSPWEIDAGGYGENVKAYYLNITNPAPESIAYRALRRFQGQNEAGVKAREFLESLGYDGVNNGDEEYIAFYPEQIKEVSNQKPTSNPDARFSLKDIDKPTYEQLITKPDIQVVDLRGSSFEWDDNLSAKNNYERNGLFSAPIINSDTKEGLFITPNTLTHAISDKGASITGVIRNLPDIIKNAVLVSVETDKNASAQTDGAYVFFGAGENDYGVIPVELVVKEYETSRIMPNKYQKDYVEKHSPNTIANIHDAKGLFIQKIDLGDSFNSGRYTSLEAALPTSPKSTISVEELLGLVKGDARKHIPSETVGARLSIGDNWENAKIPERRLDSIANSLKRQFNTKMDINDLKQTIGELYDMYDMDLTEDERREVFRTMAREMESQIPESKRRDAESQGVLEKLKERPISLTESQRSEIVHTFGSMNDFRKEIAPLKLRSDGIDLETAWKDWSNSASTLGMFDSEVNPLDMPAALVDLVERLKGSRELIDHDDRVDQIVDYLENAYQESVFEEPDIDLYEAANGGWNTKWEQRDPTDSAEYKELMGDDNDGDIPLTDIRSAGFAQQIQGNKGMSGFDTLKRTLDKAAGGNQQIREWFQKVIERPLYDAKAAYTRNRITAYNNLDKVVNEYGIKAGTKESAAVQWYGEGYRVNDDGTRQAYTLNDLKQEFPDTWQNIQKMEQWCRNQYNEYVDKINGALESIYPDVEEKALAKLASLQDSRDGLVNQARSIEEHIRRGETSAAYSGDTLAYVQRQISDLNKQIDEMERSIRDGSYLRNKRLIPRTDYFHHFNEVSNKGIGGLKNLLRGQMTLIDTELVGKSDTTKPKSKWMSFLQSRGNGEFTADAVGGMAKYMPGAEFVIAMDPAIAHMRAVIKELATSTKKTRNANGLISYLTNYTNDIAGKTAGIDRSIMNFFGEVDGRAKLDAIRRLNSRFKANAVGGNIRSALAQFSNIPTAMGVIKSDTAWIKGLRDYLDLKVKRSSDLLDSSEFMTERYFDDSIDRFTEDSFGKKIKQFSNAMLEFGDREAAQWIWFSAYEEALEKGVADPVFYADQATQQSVGGRGVGEVPYNMSTKVVNLLAPFQVEVNNTWQQMKKMVSEKDAKGLMRFMIGSFVLESMMEQVFGIDVIPDFLGTMIDTIIGAWREKDEEEPDYQGVIGKGIRDAIGEIIGAIPGASLIAPVIFGIDSDTGEALFGEGNPSRYGTGLGGLSKLSSTAAELVKAGVGEQELGDVDLFSPMVETLLPFGGRQLTRTYQTAQDLGWLPAETWGNIPFAGGEYREVPGSYTNSGALRFELPSSPETPEDVMEMARALMLGEYSTQAGREYLETRKPQVSASKMEKVNEYAGAGYDPQEFIDFYASADSNGNGSISQAEAQEYLDSTDLDNDQKLMIWTLIGPNWKKNPYA